MSRSRIARASSPAPGKPPRKKTRHPRAAARFKSGTTRSDLDTFSGNGSPIRRDAHKTGMPSTSDSDAREYASRKRGFSSACTM